MMSESKLLRDSADQVWRPPLAVEVVSFLEEKIITRAFAPGERLIELDLCERYGISRTPMREALRLLEASGLVIRRPRLGVRVAPMTLENLDQIYACRAPLEALAAGAVAEAPAERRGLAVIALRGCLERMASHFAADDIDACFCANVALTDLLHRESRNPVLTGLIDQLNKPALRYRHWAYRESRSFLPIALRENGRIIEAIAAGDRPQAEAVTRALVETAWRLLRQAFAEGGPSLNRS